MEKKLQLTPFTIEEEEYILTSEEEVEVIRNTIGAKKNHKALKYAGMGMPMKAIEEKLATIDWGVEINNEEVLKRANSNKHYWIWQNKQRELERNEAIEKRKQLKEEWTANRFYSMMKYVSEKEYGKPLLVNDNTMQIIKPLCYFLSEDERFETELGYSLKKGIVFRGISGLGKTHLTKCVSGNWLNPIYIISLLEISEIMKENGAYEPPLAIYPKLFIDDVGSEDASVVNHYGTKANWLKNFLEIYYLRSQQYNRILISTNISFSQMEEKYGFRVRSRMKDMFNIINLNGTDLRGK